MKNLEQLGPLFPGSRIGFLLIHGLTGTPTEMKIVGKRLHRLGFTVLCPQLAGHCSSEADLVATRWTDWAKSAVDAFDRLAEHTDVIFVGGLSAGAVLGLYLAQRRPNKIRGIVLYSITLCYDGWTIPKLSFLLPLVLQLPYIGKRYRFVETFPYGIMNDALRNRILARMQSGDTTTAGFAATPGTSVRELWGLVSAVKKELPNVTTPSLLIHAKNDDVASAKKNALYVQKRVSAPSELLLLDNSYHMITVDQERNKVCDATIRFALSLLSGEEKHELAKKTTDILPAFGRHDSAESPNLHPAPLVC